MAALWPLLAWRWYGEVLDGRVKTLHPKVHGGILARRHRPDDLDALGQHGIRPIDLVVVTEDGCERLTSFTKELVTVE